MNIMDLHTCGPGHHGPQSRGGVVAKHTEVYNKKSPGKGDEWPRPGKTTEILYEPGFTKEFKKYGGASSLRPKIEIYRLLDDDNNRRRTMGDYVYKTTPRLVQPDATIRLDLNDDNRPEIIHRPVAGYVYAYKPYWNSDLNKKMETRYIKPAQRAFENQNIEVPRYGAAIDAKAPGPKIGDRVFRTRGKVSMGDYDFHRIGVIINLDGTNEDQRTLPQILDPAHYEMSNIYLATYIGTILNHDYGFGKPAMEYAENLQADVACWKSRLDPDTRTLFEMLEHNR